MAKGNKALGLILAGVLCASATAAENGVITGVVDNPKLATAVSAVDRTSGEKDKKYQGKLDAETGKFTIDGLPLNCTYDVVIDFTGGRLEGIDLRVNRSDYEEEQPMSKEDVEAIKTTAKALEKFCDQVEVMTVTGNIQHAAVVINKLRTTPFYDSKPGQSVWRLELWRFEKPDETWIKSQDELFTVFYRERIQKSEYDKKSLTLEPKLGGVMLSSKQAAVDLGSVKLPGKEPGIRLRLEKNGKTTVEPEKDKKANP